MPATACIASNSKSVLDHTYNNQIQTRDRNIRALGLPEDHNRQSRWKLADHVRLPDIARGRQVTDQNGGPDSLILRYLRELDRKVDLLRDDMRDVKSRITALDAGLTLVNARIDRIENRLDRIERRLGLIEAPI
jgi:hypothetical protein